VLGDPSAVILAAVIILIRVLLCFPVGTWPEAGAGYLRFPKYFPDRGEWLIFFPDLHGILRDTGRSVFTSVCGFYAITSFGVSQKTG